MTGSAGSSDANTGGEVRVERVDDRLGLAVSRVALSGRTLVTYARDHVTVRTPSRPDFSDGNTIDLEARPAPEEFPKWIGRFDETIAIMGARHVQFRWEEPLPADAPADAPTPDPAVARAAAEAGFELSATTIFLLDRLIAPAAAPAVEMVQVEAPSAVPGGSTDRRWHASTVLYRYVVGDSPDDWRDWDQSFTDWAVDVQRELATADRCQVWVAMRHGGPVARLTLVHDRQGLASIEDVVTHPVHRRVGIASALLHRAVSHHLDAVAGSRIGIGAEPGSSADVLYRRLGFSPHATVWTLRRPAG